MDTTAFFKLTYGLYIVTSKDGEHESGCVMNTMTQVTAEPAQVCITLNKENYTTQLIEKSGGGLRIHARQTQQLRRAGAGPQSRRCAE